MTRARAQASSLRATSTVPVDANHVDGELVVTSHVDGELVDASHVDGELVEASHVDSELVEANHVDGELVDVSHVVLAIIFFFSYITITV